MNKPPHPLIAKLKPHVPEIVTAVRAGDKLAERIVNLYELVRACPMDLNAPVLCEAAFDDWIKKQGLNKP